MNIDDNNMTLDMKNNYNNYNYIYNYYNYNY